MRVQQDPSPALLNLSGSYFMSLQMTFTTTLPEIGVLLLNRYLLESLLMTPTVDI